MQVIAWKDLTLNNDLLCDEWDIKLYRLAHSLFVAVMLVVVAIDLIVQHIQDLLQNGQNQSGIRRSVSIHSTESTVSRPH